MQYDRLYHRDIRKTIDEKLVVCYLLLVLTGLLNIYASVHAMGELTFVNAFESRAMKQLVWMLASVAVAALILLVINPQLWEVISLPSYAIVVMMLVAVIFVGGDIKGSNSWFKLGAVSFQPAEISKITTSLVLAALINRPDFRLSKIRDFIIAAAVIVVPMLIIIAEKETGSALVYLGFVFVLYREGLSGWFLFCITVMILLFVLTLTASPYVSALVLCSIVTFCYHLANGKVKRWVLTAVPVIASAAFVPKLFSAAGETSFLSRIQPLWIIIGPVLISLPIKAFKVFRKKSLSTWISIISVVAGILVILSTDFVFNKVLKDHQRSRIEVLLGMKEDPTGVGYNVNQSLIAIGSGGFTGKGYLNGTQTAYGFVPEQSTDFIFCTVGEEWGFVGCVAVIGLYVFLIWGIIRDAEQSRSAFTRVYGYCVASIIFMHLFINVGMTVGLMPVIGIPLPLLSYGGSSLLSFTIMIFIFLALDRQEKRYF